MLDDPRGTEILEAVSRLMRDTLIPALPAEVVFQARVAANALDLVLRELRTGARLEDEARGRLVALLGQDASLTELEAELSRRIREGEVDLASPQLLEHLWATTMAKMSVDQPAYASYRRELEARAADHGAAG
ncbi:MAG: hypothetical protein RIS35_712 [Pseudomonadota bacterium]|jgi:hypothetical protein